MSFEGTFEKIGGFYNSLAAVIIGNLFFIGYRFFEVDTLFSKYLPMAQMHAGSTWIASKLIAVVFIFTMLLIAVNRDRFRHPIAAEYLGFFITLFINLFFWDVWAWMDWTHLVFKVGVSVITSAFDVSFAHLFIKKWQEQQARSGAEQSVSELQQSVSDWERKDSEAQAVHERTVAAIKEMEAQQAAMKADIVARTCPKCGTEFSSVNQRNGHMRGCKA